MRKFYSYEGMYFIFSASIILLTFCINKFRKSWLFMTDILTSFFMTASWRDLHMLKKSSRCFSVSALLKSKAWTIVKWMPSYGFAMVYETMLIFLLKFP